MRLGFWQAIWGTLISGGVAVAIPAAVDAYKAQLDLQKAQQDVEFIYEYTATAPKAIATSQSVQFPQSRGNAH